MRRAWFALVLCGCVASGPLPEADVRRLSERTWAAPIDEVFDATWLTLTEHGFEVIRFDRLAGVLEVRRDGRSWVVDVAAIGTSQRVTLSVEAPLARAELAQVMEVLDEGTAARLRAWQAVPEWTFDGRRNVVFVPGLAVSPPLEWQSLDFDLSRRVVTVQEKRAHTGPNRTLRLEVDRERPRSRLTESGKKALSLSLGVHDSRLTFPDELKQGTVRVLDGTTPVEATWRGGEYDGAAWQVRVVVACAGAECISLPEPVRTK